MVDLEAERAGFTVAEEPGPLVMPIAKPRIWRAELFAAFILVA
jgi:hypothetical protein